MVMVCGQENGDGMWTRKWLRYVKKKIVRCRWKIKW